MNANLKFLKELYKDHTRVLNAIKKEFEKCGGDVSTLNDPNDGPEPDENGNCPDGYIKNSEGRCIEDPGVGK